MTDSLAELLSTLRRPLDELPNPLYLPPLHSYRGTCAAMDVMVTPPGSKSLTNRALLLAALARGHSTLRGALTDADDGRQMIGALRTLGATITQRGTTVEVDGVDGRWHVASGGVALNVNNAGTAMRFLVAAAMLNPDPSSPITLDGNARMRERPIGELATLLGALGARVESLGVRGYPPLQIWGPSTDAPAHQGVLEIGRTRSSQFVSALLLVAPWMGRGLALGFTDDITSESYIEMTTGLLSRLGARVQVDRAARTLTVGGGGLVGFDFDIEPDASGATYPWAMGAVVPGLCVRVPGLSHPSLQGDARFPSLLAAMGATVSSSPIATSVTGPSQLRAIDADLSLMPDAAMTLAAAACFAEGTTTIRGLRTLRDKETDRVEATRIELSKIGVDVRVGVGGDADALVITPPRGGVCAERAERVEFETYDDHRMAMSLSLVALRRPNTWIRDPACVAKTYPGYWAELSRLYEVAAKGD